MPETPKSTKTITLEVASARADHLHVPFGNTMRPSDGTLIARGKGKGLKIYRELERDAHAQAVLHKRRMAVVARPWDIEAASENAADVRAAEEVRQQFEGMRFNQFCYDLLDALLMGFAAPEVMYEVEGSRIRVVRHIPRDQRRFTFDLDGNLRLLTRDALLDGIEVPDRKFVVHRNPAPDGNPFGLGLGSVLFWPVLFKRQDIGFWLRFTDKFSLPTSIAKYRNPDDKFKALQAAMALRGDGAVAVPEDFSLGFQEVAKGVAGSYFEQLARYCDGEISKAVLGETGTTDQQGSGGSRARDQVGNEVRLEIAEADADQLCETLNATLIRWIVDLNVPGAGYPCVVRRFEDEDDLNTVAERDTKIYQMGYEPSEEYINATYAGGDAVWTRRSNALPTDVQPPVNPAPVALSESDPVAKQLTRQLVERQAEPVAGWIETVRVALSESDSIEDAIERVRGLYPELDSSAFAANMALALGVADAAGRAEIQEEETGA